MPRIQLKHATPTQTTFDEELALESSQIGQITIVRLTYLEPASPQSWTSTPVSGHLATHLSLPEPDS